MMAKVYRSLTNDKMDELRDVSVSAERVYCRLALGRFSTRTGLIVYRINDLAAECRLRHGEIEKALTELAEAGHLTRAQGAPVCYLRGHCAQFAPLSPDNRVSWTDEVTAFKYPDLALEALEDIKLRSTGGKPAANRRTPDGTPRESDRERETERDEAKASKSPSAPAPTGDMFPEARAKKTETPAKTKAQGQNRDDSPTDQGVTRGKVEVVEKTKKEKAPPQPWVQVVDLWNELLLDNAKAGYTAGKYAKHFNVVVAEIGIDRIRELFTLAQRHDYHSGHSEKFGARSLDQLLTVEKWDKFCKDVTFTPKQKQSTQFEYEVLS